MRSLQPAEGTFSLCYNCLNIWGLYILRFFLSTCKKEIHRSLLGVWPFGEDATHSGPGVVMEFRMCVGRATQLDIPCPGCAGGHCGGASCRPAMTRSRWPP